MVIEYIGEVIRTELSELREKLYEARVSFDLPKINGIVHKLSQCTKVLFSKLGCWNS